MIILHNTSVANFSVFSRHIVRVWGQPKLFIIAEAFSFVVWDTGQNNEFRKQ